MAAEKVVGSDFTSQKRFSSGARGASAAVQTLPLFPDAGFLAALRFFAELRFFVPAFFAGAFRLFAMVC